MSTMSEWLGAACAELGIDPDVVDQQVILDVARDVAHQVARPAAPLTAFLLGIAVGGGQSLPAAAERLTSLATGWQANGPD